jgi:hypothetical protein
MPEPERDDKRGPQDLNSLERHEHENPANEQDPRQPSEGRDVPPDDPEKPPRDPDSPWLGGG